MKQTPIPKKIKMVNTTGMSEFLIYDLKLIYSNFNSLIDVLTEQQKRLDAIDLRVLSLDEGQEAHGEWHENNRVEDLIPIINEMQGMKPYTAMRSTGEKIADEQENRKKQMKEDMRIVLDEFWMNGKEAGYLMKYDNVITTDKIIDRILAIVKGE